MGSKKDFLEELFYRDQIVPTWKNLGQMAARLYDYPEDAFDVLTKNANKTLKATDLKRFYLTQFIEDQRDKKINKGKGLRTVIRENLEGCCKLINIPFNLVGPSQTQINENPKLRGQPYSYAFDETIEKIDRKYRRVVDDPEVKKEFKKWQKEEFRRKEFTAFLTTYISKKKK